MIIDPYAWHPLPIATIMPLTPSVLSVRVPRPAGYTYQAGQYVVMRVTIDGAPLLRQYSFASAPHDEMIEFLVQREPGGIVTNWFHDTARIGMEIAISQPFGRFVVENDQPPTTLIAGRVGIVPFLSMIREQLMEAGSTKLSLLYSARGEDDFCYKELLEQTSANLFDSQRGERITPDILRSIVDPAGRYYVCGSKRFVDSIAAELYRLGAPTEHIRRELFTLQ